MNRFVEACRREWKRLGVSDDVAAEMAADLEADLAEAAADGVAPEELLGPSAVFAATWAAERGVVRAPRRRRRLLAASAVFVVVALVGAVLAIVGGPSSTRGAWLTAPPSGTTDTWVVVQPPSGQTDPVTALVHVDRGPSSRDLRQAGFLVLVAGLCGLLLLSYGPAWIRTRDQGIMSPLL